MIRVFIVDGKNLIAKLKSKEYGDAYPLCGRK
jgi:hypothetical protein